MVEGDPPGGYDVNILVLGSTHSFSDGGETDVVPEKAFKAEGISEHLQNIIAQDPAISDTVKVTFEDVFKTKTNFINTSKSGTANITEHCYSLAQHFFWPDGKTDRLSNLHGENGTEWDYIVLCADPYIMANFPGMYAEGMKLIKDEVTRSNNPSPPQLLLLAQWPENGSNFSANDFNEVVYRMGNSADLSVVPASKVWDSYTSQDSNAAHPTPRGSYLAAASVFSKLYNRSAADSDYSFDQDGSNIANHANSVVQANSGDNQYSGDYDTVNAFTMKYVTKRTVSYRETGTSTENGIAGALNRLDDVQRITLNTTAVGSRWDFNYGRGNDWWEDEKDYEVDPGKYDRSYGFPMHYYNTGTAPLTMPYGIDKHYHGSTYEDGTDLGIAYNMVRPNTRETGLPEGHDVRAIPIRLMHCKMEQQLPGLNPLRDNTHMSNNLDDATAAFMYTLMSGRCPIVEEPTTVGSGAWKQWLGHKIGYESAWRMSHLTTRVPGFQVMPSAASATTVTPTATDTMSVRFWYPPQSNVTVTVTCSNETAAIVGPKTLTFTPTNFNIPQQVTVAGIPGVASSEDFEVVFATTSDDEVYNGLGDSWAYGTTRSNPVNVTRVDNGTTPVVALQNTPLAVALNAAGSNASNTILIGPSFGSVIWSSESLLDYTPDNNYLGSDQILYSTTVGTSQTYGCIDISVVVPSGQVNVTVGDPSSAEEGPNSGTFVINRTGADLASPLDVLFSLNGSATLNSDYTISHTSPVTIPTGESQVTITVSPIDDSIFGERGETVVLDILPSGDYPLGAGSTVLTIMDNDNRAPTVDAGAPRNLPWQFVTTAAGLNYGTVPGNINVDTPNPETSLLVDVPAQTENSIAGNTTEIYTGSIFDADGQISFTEHIDDKARIWIDDNLALSNDTWNSRSSTSNLNLAPGWHTIEIRISNGGGGSGPVGGEVGIRYDPSGGTTWLKLVDPGDGSFLRVNQGQAGAETTLDGSVDDLDGDPLTHIWSVSSGPAPVTFSDVASLDSTATFTVAGEYVLRLTVDDGYEQVSSEVMIIVNPALPAKYATWSEVSFDQGFTAVALTENQDGDRMSNLAEFAFGTDPTVHDGSFLAMDGSSNGMPIPVDDGGGAFEFYFIRRDDHGTSGSVRYTVQFSSDLGTFYDSLDTPTFVIDSSVDANYEVVKAPYPASLPNGQQARYGRIRIDIEP